MATKTFVSDGTAHRDIRNLYVSDGTAWRDVKKAWVSDGTAWRLVFQNMVDPVAINSDLMSYTSTVHPPNATVAGGAMASPLTVYDNTITLPSNATVCTYQLYTRMLSPAQYYHDGANWTVYKNGTAIYSYNPGTGMNGCGTFFRSYNDSNGPLNCSNQFVVSQFTAGPNDTIRMVIDVWTRGNLGFTPYYSYTHLHGRITRVA